MEIKVGNYLSVDRKEALAANAAKIRKMTLPKSTKTPQTSEE